MFPATKLLQYGPGPITVCKWARLDIYDSKWRLCHFKTPKRISKEEAGLFVLINHRDAKSYWLNKLEDKEVEPKANRRVIGVGSQILRALDLKKISVLGTPTKYNAVSGFNIEITGFINE